MIVAGAVLAAILLSPWRGGAAQFELTVDPGSRGQLAERITSMDREAIARALGRAGLAPPERVRITLIDADDPRAAATPRWIVGQAFGTSAIVIVPARISAYPYDSLESVVLHEIVHLALNARADGRPLPRWFHEGVAVSVESGWGVTGEMRLLVAALRDPAIDDVSRLFQSGSQPDTTTAYLLAAALAGDIRRRHGEGVPGAIAGRVAAGAPFDEAFAAETGTTVEGAAAAAWARYRSWRRWLPVAAGPGSLWTWILVLAFIAFLVRLRKRRGRRRRWDAEESPGVEQWDDEPPGDPRV